MSDIDTPGPAAVQHPASDGHSASAVGDDTLTPVNTTVHRALPEDERPIDLLAYVRRLGRFLLPGAVLGLVVAVLMALFSGTSASAVTYNTKAHVMLQTSTADVPTAITQSQEVSKYMWTFVDLGDDTLITKDVATALHNKYTTDQIASMMKVYWGGGGLLLAVQASAPNHQDALAISEAGAKSLVAHQAQLIKMSGSKAPKLVLVQDAIDNDPATTGGSSGSSLISRIAEAVGVGIVVAVLVAIVLEWLNSRRRRQRAGAGTIRA